MTTAATRVWTFATVIVIIAMVALGWFLGVAPKLAEITRFESEHAAVVAQNELGRVTLARIQEDFAKLDEFKVQLADIQTEFPELPEHADALQSIIADVVANGLTIQNLTLGEPTPADPTVVVDQFGQVPAGTLLQMTIALSVRGDAPAVLAAIDALQKSDRFVFVSTFAYTGGQDPGSRSATISLAVFMISGTPAEGALPVSGVPVAQEPPAEAPGEE